MSHKGQVPSSAVERLLPARERRLIVEGLVAVLLAIAAIGVHFIHAEPLLDDKEELAHVASLSPSWRVLGPDAYGFWRPVKNIVFMAFDRWAPERPEVWHATAILLYMGTTVLVFLLSRRLMASSGWALCSTAVWALAPTQVSAIAWKSCINIVIMTFAAVASLLGYDALRDSAGSQRTRRTGPWLCVSLLSFAVALVSYEIAITLPALLLLWDWARGRSWPWREPRGRALAGAYVLVAAVYLVVRQRMSSGMSIENDSFPPDMGPLEVSAASAMITTDHLWTWLWPFGRQNICGAFVTARSFKMVLAMASSWILVTGIAGIAWAVRHRAPRVSTGLAWFFVSFLPVSNLIPFRNGPYGDYYLVLPSIGIAWVVVELCRGLLRLAQAGQTPWRRWIPAVGLFLLGVWRLGTAAIASDWAEAWNSESEIFRRTLRLRPYAFTARASLAQNLLNEGRLEEAERMAREARDQAPWHGMAYFVLGSVHMRAGRIEQALEMFDQARAVKPQYPYPDTASGFIYDVFLHDPEKAEQYYRTALRKRWDQTSVTAAINLAEILARKGELREAIDIMEWALRRAPRSPELLHNLALAFRELGDPEKAVAYAHAYRKVKKERGARDAKGSAAFVPPLDRAGSGR